MSPQQTDQFIQQQTAIDSPPLVPGIRLHLASEVTPLWKATQDFLDHHQLPPPFWAFAWPGGQALARFLLDNPEYVRGKTVLAFAAGSGVDAIAAALAGAATVIANEIDPFAARALHLNSRLNGVSLVVEPADLIGTRHPDWQVVIAGDVCYERPMASRVIPWLTSLAASGVTVLTADPGRTYLPSGGLTEVARYAVPTSLELEDRTCRETALYLWDAPATALRDT